MKVGQYFACIAEFAKNLLKKENVTMDAGTEIGSTILASDLIITKIDESKMLSVEFTP